MTFNPQYTHQNNKNILSKLDNNVIINKKLFSDINTIKSQIDNIESDKWKLIRHIVTEYEFVGNNRYHNIKQLNKKKCISRAYYKLWELLCQFEPELQLYKNKNKSMRFAGLAEAPGGFIQCLVDYHGNNNDDLTGISLKDCEGNKIDWKTGWLMRNKNIKLIFGDENKGHNGNLYNPEIINYYCNYYRKKKADLVTSDGGFLLSGLKENHKGQYHNGLFLSETFIALRILKQGGHFIMKIYDVVNKTMIDILTILNKVFNKVKVVKPVTSREMNNENYVVCIGYKRNDNIISEISKMINHLWENKNELIIDSIFENNEKHNNYYARVSRRQLIYQKCKLNDGVRLKQKSNEALRQDIREVHKHKTRNAYDWLKKNHLY